MKQQRKFDPCKATASRCLRHDPARLLEDFQSEAKAARRDQKLTEALKAAGSHDLAEDLLQAAKRDEPLPEWSNGRHRAFRRWLTNQTTILVYEAKKETGHLSETVSVVTADLTAPIGRLSAIARRPARTNVFA